MVKNKKIVKPNHKYFAETLRKWCIGGITLPEI